MTVSSVLRDRLVRWAAELTADGYELSPAERVTTAAGELAVRARRPVHYGGPPATIDVRELWVAGTDPDGLGLEQHGC